MPFYPNGSIGLQSVLSQSSADLSLSSEYKGPHYPITCSGDVLGLEEDGTMFCEHSVAGPDHPRNQAVIDASVAILIIEIAVATL